MSIRSGHVIWQIERACELIASLIARKKLSPKEEVEVNQMLSDLTGLDRNLFADPNSVRILPIMLGPLDDSQKALTAKFLQIKNPDLYGDLAERLLGEVDWSKVHSKVQK